MPFRPLTPEERAQAQAEKDAELQAVEEALQARAARSQQTMKASLTKADAPTDSQAPPKEDFFINRQANPYTPPEDYTKPVLTDEPDTPKAPRPEKIKMPSADGILESCLKLVQGVIDSTPPIR